MPSYISQILDVKLTGGGDQEIMNTRFNVDICTNIHFFEQSTDYGHPMKPFFIEIQNFWAWEDKQGKQIMWRLGYFRPNYQHPFWYSESLAHVFHYSIIISTKKLSLYIHIFNIFSGLGFECLRVSIVRGVERAPFSKVMPDQPKTISL